VVGVGFGIDSCGVAVFRDNAIVGCWTALADRLDRAGVLARWASLEPALDGVGSVGELPTLTAQGCDPQAADELIGALVRRAAVAGGGDADAAVLVVHLLSRGVLALARRLADLSDCVVDLAVGELCCQIRAFPIDRRHRAYAASLLRDTRSALLAELRPARRRAEVLIDPLDGQATALWEHAAAAAVSGGQGPELGEVLRYAVDARLVSADDARLLTEVTRHGGYGGRGRERAASALGCSVRTVGRRRASAVAALHRAAPLLAAALT